MAAFIQYLNFDGVDLPLPDSYEVGMSDVEADSGGEDVIIGLSRNDFQKKEGHGGLVLFNVTQ
jgi:hypothetical protein